MTVLIMVGTLIFGIIGYQLLPINALPNVDFPSIQVQAQLSGANPDTMASRATPLRSSLDHRRVDIDDVGLHRRPGDHHAYSRWTATSTPPRRTQSAIVAAARSLPCRC
jgi:hypothetical protein